MVKRHHSLIRIQLLILAQDAGSFFFFFMPDLSTGKGWWFISSYSLKQVSVRSYEGNNMLLKMDEHDLTEMCVAERMETKKWFFGI